MSSKAKKKKKKKNLSFASRQKKWFPIQLYIISLYLKHKTGFPPTYITTEYPTTAVVHF